MSFWKLSLIVLVLLATNGCITKKYAGLEQITTANPKGWNDAVNGSYYRDGGDDSERMMTSLGQYINQLEFELESKR